MTGHAAVCGRILVVDDDPDFLALTSVTLESAGFTIVAARTGLEALELARSTERPDLVVLDVQLPGISGYEICKELRDEFGEALPILFVSGFRTEALDRVAGLLVGADDYLVKPFAPDELIGRVRALMRRSHAGVWRGTAWGLTRREAEVLRLLAAGLRQEEIASRLVVSHRTVGAHIQNILGKMGATSRTQAVALAYRRDLTAS